MQAQPFCLGVGGVRVFGRPKLFQHAFGPGAACGPRRRSSIPSFPRTRESRTFRARTLKSPDPRVRGNDDQKPAGLMTRIRSPMRCPLREMEKGRRLFPPAFGLLRAGQAAAFAALRSLLLR
ncbi:hypothetical protein [Lysobacter gummosus]|uniref:hypothetical protein n=1 Tax=Lysobacter gummosus TaxID=262324 RepID=UPI003635EA1B